MPVAPAIQVESLKPSCVHVMPRLPSLGIKTFALAPEGTRLLVVTCWARPYEISGYWGGNVGANSVAILRSGFSKARYSPLALRLKSVCKGEPGTARFLPEAKTTRNPLADRKSTRLNSSHLGISYA